jgi:maleylpyruvate isomerase
MPVPQQRLDLAQQGELFFQAALQRADDLSAPSALPGWTRAMVAAHVARNADALGNLLAWARTGVETPMYASLEARAAGIEESTRQPAELLRADVATSSTRLQEAMVAMPAAGWDAVVKTARGRDVPASDVVWMRVRESWVHGVDLDVGASFDELPDAVVADMIDEVARGLAGRDDCPATDLAIGGSSWRLGPAVGDAVAVRAPAPAVLAWLIGRQPLDGAPTLPAWL